MRAFDHTLRIAVSISDRAVRAVVWISAVAAGAILLLTTGLIALEVALRAMGRSTLMADEYSGYMVLAVVGFGTALALQQNALLRVDFLFQYLGLRSRRFLGVFYTLVSLAFFAVLTYRTAIFAVNTFYRGTFAATPIGTPLYIPQSLVPIGFALVCLELLRRLATGETSYETKAPSLE